VVKEVSLANPPRREQRQRPARLCGEQAEVALRELRAADFDVIESEHAAIVVDCRIYSNCD
jgi:hypothetical protein